LTKAKSYDIIFLVTKKKAKTSIKKSFQKIFKKVLTKAKSYDIIFLVTKKKAKKIEL
jgi:ribosomal protein L23